MMNGTRGVKKFFTETSGMKTKAKVWLSVLLAMMVLVSMFAVFAGAEPEGEQGQGTNNEVPTHVVDECAVAKKDVPVTIHRQKPDSAKETVTVIRDRRTVVDDFSPDNGSKCDIDFTKYIKDVKVQVNNGALLGPDKPINVKTTDKVTFWFYYSLCGGEMAKGSYSPENSVWVHYDNDNYTYISPYNLFESETAAKYETNTDTDFSFTIPGDTDYVLDDTRISYLYTSPNTEGHLYMNADWIQKIVSREDYRVDIVDEISVQYPAAKPSAEEGLESQAEGANRMYLWFPNEYEKDGTIIEVKKKEIAVDGDFSFSANLSAGKHTVDFLGGDGFYGNPGPFKFIVEEDKEEEGTHHYTGTFFIAKQWEKYSKTPDKEINLTLTLNYTDGTSEEDTIKVPVYQQNPNTPYRAYISDVYGGKEVKSWTLKEKMDNLEDRFICSSVEERFVAGASSDIPEIIFTNSEKTSISISKQAVGGGPEIEGAQLKLYEVTHDDEGNEKRTQRSDDWSWTSTKEVHKIDGIIPGDYVLIEEIAPDGYLLVSNKIGFTVDSDYNIIAKTGDGYAQSGEYALSGTAADGGYNLTVYDDYTRVNIEKREVSATDKQGALLSGATLALYDSTGEKELYRWDTESSNPKSLEHIAPGKYILKELEVPAGCLKAEDMEIEVKAQSALQTFTMEDDFTKVEITKVDEANTPIAGAKLELYKGTEKIDSWTSDTTAKTFTKLEPGKYTLVETSAPDGFQKAADMEITVEGKADVQTFTMVDKSTLVEVLKVDDKGNPLPGAKLRIVDNKGAVVSVNGKALEWVSEEEAFTVYGLKKGTYKVVEVEAPSGYVIGAEKSFLVTDEPQTIKVTYENSKTKVEFIKYDEKGKPLAGASLEIRDSDQENANTIKDKDGKPLAWTSGTDPKVITGIPAGTYYLVETKAPNGYAIAAPVKFVISDSSTKTVEVKMTDNLNQLKLAKQDVEGNFLPGAGLGLRDAQGNKVQNKNGDEIADWTSQNAWHTVSGLLDGTYYLVETSVPKGYLKAEPVEIKVENGGFFVNGEAVIEAVMLDELNKVEISKESEAGDPVYHATLRILDENGKRAKDYNGKEIPDWTTSSSERTHVVIGLPAGNYKLVEVKTPAGYLQADPVEFTVTDDIKTTTASVKMVDVLTKAQFIKLDEKGEPLSGASLEIQNSEGVIARDKDGKSLSWTSGKEPEVITGIPAGTYKLVETKAPAGYVTAAPVEFTIPERFDSSKPTQTVSVEMTDKQTQVEIYKVKMTTGSNPDPVVGALLELRDKDGNTVKSWKTDVRVKELTGLPVGTYTLVETEAPAGYIVADPQTIVIEDTDTVQTFVMKDNFTKIQISKTDITGKKELPGADLEIKNAEGDTLHRWTSTEQPHLIEALPAGDYVLIETTAPEGYAVAEEVKFTVSLTGEIQRVTMKDDIIKVYISKQDITNGKELPGATLQIHTKDGDLVEEWVSGDKPHYIPMLPAGEYTLTEITAPDGYVKAETVPFTVTATSEIQTVTMEDDVTKVQISKKDITNKEELPGAKLEIKDSTGKLVESWTSTDKPHYIEKLPVGEYTLTEITAPDGYATAETITFKVEDSGKIKTVEMFDDVTRVEISKKDITNKEELPGATLQIHTKDGNLVEEWVSGEKPHYIERLPVGDYVLTEITAPNGYTIAENVEFTVKDTIEIQKVEMFDDITKVQISKVDITDKKELPGASLVLTDINGNEIESWISTEEPHMINGLAPGKYILTETIAPDGFLKAESITFEVKNTVGIQKVVMEDAYTRLIISKKDTYSQKELANAVLALYDENGKLVEQWVTNGNPRYFKQLKPGKYVLVEVKAPKDYYKTDPITFILKADGSVQTVTMYDLPIEFEPTPTPVRPVSPKTADNGSVVEMTCVFGILSALTLAGACMKRKKEF